MPMTARHQRTDANEAGAALPSRILVVDDVPDNIELLRYDLEDDGFEVLVASNGQQALELVAKERPDCVLMDYHMPGMDGITACGRIKEDPEVQHIPVIMLSADDQEQAIVAGLDAGAMDYIAKPFSYPIALARINSALRVKAAHDLEQRMRLQAESSSVARTNFLASMSHEIRTPLNGVLGMVQLLFDTKLTTVQEDYLHTISNSGQMLQHLINDLLDFVKIESGMVQLEMVPTNVRQLVEDTLALFTGRAMERGVQLYGIVEADVAKNLQTDPTRLQQILTNLVSNAVKFTDSGYVTARVMMQRGDDGQDVLAMTVTDTGVGMKEDQVQSIFQPFVQADASVTRKYGGTGLGLAICRELSEAMGGHITVASEYGVGTTFTVHIPVTGGRQPTQRQSHQLPVLVIDPVPDGAECLQCKLQELGFPADVVHEPDELDELLVEGRTWSGAFVHLDADDVRIGTCIQTLQQSQPELRLVLTGAPALRKELQALMGDGDIRFLTLPYRVAQLAASLELKLGSNAEPSRPLDLLAGTSVLVAEDNVVNQKVIERLLEKMGCVVTMADNGQKVLALLEEQMFDCILMDCHMPELDGFDTTRAIRQREAEAGEGQHLPIVALTASKESDPCIEAGMDAFLCKPLSREEIFETLVRMTA